MHSDFERLDYLISQMDRAFFVNLDPTPVFKGILNASQVRKGSDNAIQIPQGADASYLEASFAGAEAGKEHILTILSSSLKVNREQFKIKLGI